MKTSILVLAAIASLSLSSISSYAKDEMNMKSTDLAVQNDISGTGTVVSKDKAEGSVMLSHEAIPAIGWGAMTMNFKVKDKVMFDKVKEGTKVQFTLVKQSSEYIITSIK